MVEHSRNIKILHFGSEARDELDSRNHALQHPCIYEAFWAATYARVAEGDGFSQRVDKGDQNLFVLWCIQHSS